VSRTDFGKRVAAKSMATADEIAQVISARPPTARMAALLLHEDTGYLRCRS
jgi:hypothetical protein